jgi:hypothetical protein
MKRTLFSLISLIWIISLMAGCPRAPVAIQANVGDEFMLSIGQEAHISGENLKIGFEDVIGDSRCPLDVTCIWEGRVNILVQLTYDDTAYNVVLNEPGLTDHAMDMFLNYSIVFHLEPYPVEAANILKEDYRLRMTINRQ